MVEDGLVLSMATIMSEQEDFGRLCATVREIPVTPRLGPTPYRSACLRHVSAGRMVQLTC